MTPIKAIVIHADRTYDITTVNPEDLQTGKHTPNPCWGTTLWTTSEGPHNALAEQFWAHIDRTKTPHILGTAIITGNLDGIEPVPDKIVELFRKIVGQAL